ncbi:MAG: diacylglycerol kinase [Spirochaetaceae bacterium]|jgi:diacylglycerol kinase family enzyme|nr:diacylglycerol kinase [Spirochaetaceae bacterium]
METVSPKLRRSLVKLRSFGAFLSEIIAGSLAAPGKPLRWTIIANPGAGGFTINRRWKKHEKVLAAKAEQARGNPFRKNALPSVRALAGPEQELGAFGLIPTAAPGHARTITRDLIKEAARSGDFYLIVTAGGDGTSLEVLEALFQAPESFRSRCVILRLPLGTGNDGADAWELADALDFLIRPSRIEFTRGLILSTASGKTWPGGDPLLAFNILSAGLDAFVTHMTNKMKGNLPGDSYKLWVDIASLLYDRLYKVGPMDIRAFDDRGREIQNFREKVLLCAMGASGRRSYGSRKMILPDDRNVCVVEQMPLFRKVALKDLFTTGEHIHQRESKLFTAVRIVLSGEYPVLAQMDGETILLTKEDFPAVIELTEKVIPVLRKR